ncbi:hypothetical protein MSG28_009958 [Choristoneura fumiferana]|uniref:Uncharacterized protein n=1 Tax=Choristoneura fumiferana TaxID=7141 RepID=A0ACC0JD45_CHOFU|nr:hypothetical protein MSG28_009958 [Choristoneura fumiferana]
MKSGETGRTNERERESGAEKLERAGKRGSFANRKKFRAQGQTQSATLAPLHHETDKDRNQSTYKVRWSNAHIDTAHGHEISDRLGPVRARSLRIVAESYAIKGLCLEQSALPGSSRYKQAERENEMIRSFELASELTLLYLQRGGSCASAGPAMELALQRVPLLHMRAQRLHSAVDRYWPPVKRGAHFTPAQISRSSTGLSSCHRKSCERIAAGEKDGPIVTTMCEPSERSERAASCKKTESVSSGPVETVTQMDQLSYRSMLCAVEAASTQALRLALARQLAELLMRGLTGQVRGPTGRGRGGMANTQELARQLAELLMRGLTGQVMGPTGQGEGGMATTQALARQLAELLMRGLRGQVRGLRGRGRGGMATTQALARQLAELLMRGLTGQVYKPPEVPPVAVSAGGTLRRRDDYASDGPWKPKRYAAINQFVPRSEYEEIILLLLVGEAMAVRDAVLSQSAEFEAARAHALANAVAVADLLVVCVARWGQLCLVLERCQLGGRPARASRVERVIARRTRTLAYSQRQNYTRFSLLAHSFLVTRSTRFSLISLERAMKFSFGCAHVWRQRALATAAAAPRPPVALCHAPQPVQPGNTIHCIQAAVPTVDIYLPRLDMKSTPAAKFPLESQRANNFSSFRFQVPAKHQQIFLRSVFWPEGVVFRRFWGATKTKFKDP